jgi:hypothetical protein
MFFVGRMVFWQIKILMKMCLARKIHVENLKTAVPF